jgi:hypothetical protein
LEVYKLIDNKYELMESVSLLQENRKVVWMPEVGLGIGCESDIRGNWEREWVYWYDRSGVRYPTSKERTARAEAISKAAEQRAERLAERLRMLGIDPDV